MAGSHALQLDFVLDRLGIGDGALHLLDLVVAADGSLNGPRGGVGDQVLAVGRLLDVSEEAAVGLDLDLAGGEVLADGLVGLGFLDVEDGFVLRDRGVAVEDRVVVDIVAAHVEEPSNLIQSRDVDTGGLLLSDLLAELGELVFDALASVLLRVDESLVGGCGGTLAAPDLVDQVIGDGNQSRAASLLDRLRELLRHGGGDERGVDARRLAVLALLRDPVLPGDLLGDAELNQSPVLVQLRSSLVEVSAVGRECRRLLADDGGASGSIEAGDVFAAVEAVSSVLGSMTVAGGNDCLTISAAQFVVARIDSL